jgi:hypothetical protein
MPKSLILEAARRDIAQAAVPARPSPMEKQLNPPDEITPESYRAWLDGIGASDQRHFYDSMFAWYTAQHNSALPPQVNADPDKIYVAVNAAKAETIALEQAGEIEKLATVGFDAYAEVAVPIATALETELFYYGKPVGQPEGDTYPADSIFGRAHRILQQKWGTGAYLFRIEFTNGGIVTSLYDDHSLLVRGSPAAGYALFVNFIAVTAGQSSATSEHMSIALLKPLGEQKTDVRRSVRRIGQSYSFLGENGRNGYGFNAVRVRSSLQAISKSMVELQTTGRIRENRP